MAEISNFTLSLSASILVRSLKSPSHRQNCVFFSFSGSCPPKKKLCTPLPFILLSSLSCIGLTDSLTSNETKSTSACELWQSLTWTAIPMDYLEIPTASPGISNHWSRLIYGGKCYSAKDSWERGLLSSSFVRRSSGFKQFLSD